MSGIIERPKMRVVETLSSAYSFKKWEDFSVGDIVVGKVVSSHKDMYHKLNPVIKVEYCSFKDGTAANYMGKELVLNSCANLANPLAKAGIVEMSIVDGKKVITKINKGQTIQVEYTGKYTLEKGLYKGKEGHDMKVELVELDTDTTPAEDFDL